MRITLSVDSIPTYGYCALVAYNPALKVSMAEAMTVACPKCYVPAHKRCVYLLGA